METDLSARTSVERPLTTRSSDDNTGCPAASKAMSVVVPPMSSTRVSSEQDGIRAIMPMTLAAGPESRASTGRSRDTESGMAPPSAFKR